MTYEEISSAKYVDARNEQLRKDFNSRYNELKKVSADDISFMAIYNHLAMVYNLSLPQVRRIVKGHK